MFKIAFVTYSEHPVFTKDDQLLEPELIKFDIQFSTIPWNTKGVRWKDFDAVVIRSCWDYYLHYHDFLNWIDYLKSEGVALWNNADVILWNADKKYLLELADNGVSIPESKILLKGQSMLLENLVNDFGWEKAVVKPVVSAGAFDTWLIDPSNARAYQQAFDEAILNREFIVQEYLSEINTEGEWSLIFFDYKYSHAILKQPAINDFRVQSEFGGSVVSKAPPQYAIEAATRIIQLMLTKNLLYARVDGVCRNGKFILMELELIEPALFLKYHSQAPLHFVKALFSYMNK